MSSRVSEPAIKAVNKMVFTISTIFDIILLAGYALEVYRGSVERSVLLGCFLIVAATIISASLTMRLDPSSLRMRVFTAIGSVAIVAFALYQSPTSETYVISLIMTLPYVLYFDTAFMVIFGAAMMLANLGMTGVSFLIKPGYFAYSSSGLTVQVLVSIAYCIALYALTRLAIQLNDEKLAQIFTAAEEQEATFVGMQQIAGSIQDNSRRGEQISNQLNENVAQVNSALQDITQVVLQRSERVVNEMLDSTTLLRSNMEGAVQTMLALEEACTKIAGMTQIISSIAMQTNLLSLNAAVESARVGEAGRGFAVVADEVKQLADKSMKSVDEIEAVIHSLQAEAKETARSLEQVSQVATQIGEVSSGLKSAFGDIEERIGAIAHLVAEVTQGVSEVAASNQMLSNEAEHMLDGKQLIVTSYQLSVDS